MTEGRRQKADGRRQKAGGRWQKQEAVKNIGLICPIRPASLSVLFHQLAFVLGAVFNFLKPVNDQVE
jgi:hypothetical protein